jgi:fatty acid desaturase
MAKDAFEDDDDVSVCSDSGINDECIKRSFSSFWRPNAHGGHHSYSSVLQPISKRYQEFTPQIRASPLEVSFIQTFFFPFIFYSINCFLWLNFLP